jgi:acyl carrier protein
MNTQKLINHFIAKEFLHDTSKAIPEDLNLIDAGIVDSLGLLRIVAFLEEELEFVIEPEDMVPENLNSICAITKMVNSQAAEVS